MKKLFSLLLVLSLLLAGCSGNITPADAPTETTSTPTEATQEATAPTEAPTEATAPKETAEKVPYLLKISRADFPIYKANNYESGIAGYISTPGTFTIVEEAEDCGGNLWGRLKSGAGWVDLALAEKDQTRGPLLEIVPLTDQLLQEGNFHKCVLSTDIHTQFILVKANVDLTNVEVLPLTLVEKLEEEKPGYTLETWKAGEMLLIEASFPGDMSTYGIRVTDSDRVTYRYNIWENLSGEGDAFSLSTYAP